MPKAKVSQWCTMGHETRGKADEDVNVGNTPQEFFDGDTPMETVGNQDTMNINHMLLQNIRDHEYFKILNDKTTFDEVVDEIYYNVSCVVPWVPGTHNKLSTTGMCSGLRGVSAAGKPSSCFVLLYKLFTLKVSGKQIAKMINHVDSPYIRCLGFLYIRFCCKPAKLWGWFGQFMNDEEEIFIQGEKYKDGTTVGKWLRQIVAKMDYYETTLPRIPIPIMKEINVQLGEHDEKNPPKGRVEAPREKTVLEKQFAAAFARRDAGRAQAAEARTKTAGGSDRGGDRDRGRDRDRDRDRGRGRSPDRRDRDRDRDRDRSRRDRSRSRSRDRRRRSRSRSRDRSRRD